MLFDTDILIWVLRGRAPAAEIVQAERSRAISQMTYLELIEGVRDRRELVTTQALLEDHEVSILPLNEEIGEAAGVLMELHALSNGLDAGDALIAATALQHDLPLCTANHKHFKAIGGLTLKVFRP